MNYEDFYAEMLPLIKNADDLNRSLAKYAKQIRKTTESGDLKALKESITALQKTVQAQIEVSDRLRETSENLNTKEYYESGEFTAQVIDEFQKRDLDVTGESPVYEVFPYRVRFDAEKQEVWLDRKKVASIRPKAFADSLKAGRDKLMNASFNSESFADELSAAYDTALIRNGKRPESDLYLKDIYKEMVPMSRFRRDYDLQSFAFDIARLYNSDVEETKKQRRFRFGTSRNGNKAIRILDVNGNEVFLSTIQFFG